ncbi:hypothetical protein SELMODRAFT_422226 [Selaginella moellendorffii]|uniref:Jacalin-type lectin domain-containing protein n=1 Tax=Selaginella moellendorffii TaxID=88036 RepID=D8SHS6_SELML|nr:hypothetical protein SELMODRAFT_422226 [Selaginella moellendorffii]
MCTLWVSFIVLLMLTVWCAGEKSPLYGGTRWAEKFDDGPSSGILSLTIYSGAVVDAIQVQTVEGLRPFHGTNTCKGCSPINPPHKLGGTRYKINLRYPDEYIYKISGYAGWSSTPSAKCCPEDYKCESYKGEWKYLSKCVQKYSFDA